MWQLFSFKRKGAKRHLLVEIGRYTQNLGRNSIKNQWTRKYSLGLVSLWLINLNHHVANVHSKLVMATQSLTHQSKSLRHPCTFKSGLWLLSLWLIYLNHYALVTIITVAKTSEISDKTQIPLCFSELSSDIVMKICVAKLLPIRTLLNTDLTKYTLVKLYKTQYKLMSSFVHLLSKVTKYYNCIVLNKCT